MDYIRSFRTFVIIAIWHEDTISSSLCNPIFLLVTHSLCLLVKFVNVFAMMCKQEYIRNKNVQLRQL